MKTLLILALAAPLTVGAQSRMLETTEEARQRNSAERYETYRDRGNQAPLGGYRDSLGSPAPRGTDSPGYIPSGPVYRDRGRDDDRSTPSDRLRGGGYIEPVVPNRRR